MKTQTRAGNSKANQLNQSLLINEYKQNKMKTISK